MNPRNGYLPTERKARAASALAVPPQGQIIREHVRGCTRCQRVWSRQIAGGVSGGRFEAWLRGQSKFVDSRCSKCGGWHYRVSNGSCIGCRKPGWRFERVEVSGCTRWRVERGEAPQMSAQNRRELQEIAQAEKHAEASGEGFETFEHGGVTARRVPKSDKLSVAASGWRGLDVPDFGAWLSTFSDPLAKVREIAANGAPGLPLALRWAGWSGFDDVPDPDGVLMRLLFPAD
ncbi:hypothetical protein PQQ65_27945 [Paraburkholderia strydomiana]|uniref:hypothetical protein n=1 Tax=Paraburkholderia strydomiana TaxID=1245417 RepID=UPI0038B76ACD